MNGRTDIPETLYNDEIVRFFATRHHATPQDVLQCFYEQNGIASEMTAGAVRLEDNERAILHDMIVKMTK